MVILMLQFLFADLDVYLMGVTLTLFFFLSARVPGADSTSRPTAFFSSILNRDIVYGYNHLGYVLLMALLVFEGLSSLFSMEIDSLWMGLYFWVSLGITLTFLVNLSLLVYGIITNTTPNEMFESHRNPQLWRKIDYFPHSNYVMRVYKNQNRKDPISNLKAYFNYQP